MTRSRIRPGTRRSFYRDFEAGQYLDLFLVAAVTTLLTIRFYLRLTGYPRIEAGSVHVAHMLWGGLLMLAAVVILLSYVGRGAHQLAALLGGTGFGAFIDELGKFITKDNDYFYKPTVALIYVVFILLYLMFRSIHREQIGTRRDFLVNALQELTHGSLADLTREEKTRVLRYLDRSDPDDPLVAALEEVTRNSPAFAVERQGPLETLRGRIVRLYRRMAVTRGFHTAVVSFFVGQLVLKLALTTAQIFMGGTGRGVFFIPALSLLERGQTDRSVIDWAQFVSSLLSGVFVMAGGVLIRRSRLAAFRMFQRSVLVSIFLTQVFSFYREEFSAVVGLAFNLLVFLALRFMIERETTRPRRTGAGRGSRGG